MKIVTTFLLPFLRPRRMVGEMAPTEILTTWRVFEINDCEWWVARSLQEAISSYCDEYKMHRKEVMEDDPHELTNDELDGLTFYTDAHNDPNSGIPFSLQLANLILEGLSKPGFFATTEI